MALPSQIDVLIVGAGPTGLTTACLLQQSGIKTMVIEAAPAPATTSRAAVIHLRTLEVLEKLDLAADIIDQGLPVNEMALYDRDTLLNSINFGGLHSQYKHAVALPQADTEKNLTKKLHELQGHIYHNHAVVGLKKNDKTGADVTVEDKSTGTTTTVSAKYVVAADGLHSTMRHAIDVPFDGEEYPQAFLTADIHMDPLVWPHQHMRDSTNVYLSPAGMLLVIPFPSTKENLWRIVATLPSAPAKPDRDLCNDIVRSRGPKMSDDATVVTDVVWSSHFRIHHRLARQYRKNRVFLAGDAAHVHSPAGGQGMNTGIQDGAYLSTVIADALLSGRDSDQDLDRYEKTRRPVARGVVGMTHKLTVAMTTTNPLICWIRNRLLWLVPTIVPGLRKYMSWKLSELEH